LLFINRILVDGIPTLDTLAKLSLPPPPAPHPALGGAKEYAKQRKKYLQSVVYDKVVAVTKPRIPAILKLATWDDKQNAIDELYETVESQLKDQEDILGRNPNFGTWVEKALEEYLKSVDAEILKKEQDTAKDMSTVGSEADEGSGPQDDDIAADAAETVEEEEDADEGSGPEDDDIAADAAETVEEEENADKGSGPEDDGIAEDDNIAADAAATVEEEEDVVDDANADPIFMDLYNEEDGAEAIVPKILHPLKPHARDGPGRMVEEWELSAHKETKRILLRQCTRQIARALEDNTSSRVYVHGRNGVGKVSVAI
jgi:hypothetical protein